MNFILFFKNNNNKNDFHYWQNRSEASQQADEEDPASNRAADKLGATRIKVELDDAARDEMRPVRAHQTQRVRAKQRMLQIAHDALADVGRAFCVPLLQEKLTRFRHRC